jgi:hypothetical protein
MPKRGVFTAWVCLVDIIIKKKPSHLYLLDVLKCFDRIQWSSIDGALKINGIPKKLRKLIMSIISHCSYELKTTMKIDISSLNECLIKKRNILRPTKGIGIIQGSPLSPVLCNIVLSGLDKFMESNQHDMVRYADDILVISKQSINLVRTSLGLAGLDLSEKKTEVIEIRDEWW